MTAETASTPPDLGTRHQFHGIQPVLPVSDVSRAARYFRDVLGFELDFIAGEPPSYARVKHVPLGADCVDAVPQGEQQSLGRPGALSGDRSYGDPVYIRLWQCNARETRQWRGEIVIHVGQDVDGLHAAYKQRGVDVIEPPVSQPWGLREFAIREPDGHVLRFCGYL
ncbi:VOC family protein [Variovorax sp. J22G21]|uniref:VOC family protein n=1 Tax=Variovorax TaxID=34072 RepID=UPI002578CF87|nr:MULTISPECIES: VOC family protein [unclassified Variovorax]MDM0040302.1 VOC family protein [Variovorax sp. J22R193]MDM0061675.1 VOC family protein [Variovorax sp. J22G21]